MINLMIRPPLGTMTLLHEVSLLIVSRENDYLVPSKSIPVLIVAGPECAVLRPVLLSVLVVFPVTACHSTKHGVKPRSASRHFRSLLSGGRVSPLLTGTVSV